jgi:peptide-methionine (S)-S-oxide reductase
LKIYLSVSDHSTFLLRSLPAFSFTSGTLQFKMLSSTTYYHNNILSFIFLLHFIEHGLSFSTPLLTTFRTQRRVPSSRTPNRKGSIKIQTFLTMATETNTAAGKKRPLRSIHSILPGYGTSSAETTTASVGDIVTVDVELTPEDNFVPEHLFDSSGQLTFVLGWGNYLPGLHELLLGGVSVGDSITNVSVDAGFGRRNSELVIEIPKTNLKQVKNIENIVPNTTLSLQGGIKVNVVDVTKDTIIVDANHPLAGSSYSCNLKVLSIDKYPVHKLEVGTMDDEPNGSRSPFEVATFAMGCFWGVELAFMRTPGVVGTRAGYSQGRLENPSYEEIKEGHTGYREAVMVVYDSRVVSYNDILAIYNERLTVTAPEYFKLDIFAEEDEDGDDTDPSSSEKTQYKHGIYFHNDEQKQLAGDYIASIKDSRYCDVELLPANVFYSAEDHQQQYLYKGGQAARKGCRETIRCYG